MPSRTLLSLDYGTKKTGVAYSVEGFCFGWKTIPSNTLTTELPKMIAEKRAEALIVGMPYHIDGHISSHGKRVQAWCRSIQEHLPIPIILHDERLTSSEATLAFYDAGIQGDIDAESARLILEDYLSTQK